MRECHLHSPGRQRSLDSGQKSHRCPCPLILSCREGEVGRLLFRRDTRVQDPDLGPVCKAGTNTGFTTRGALRALTAHTRVHGGFFLLLGIPQSLVRSACLFCRRILWGFSDSCVIYESYLLIITFTRRLAEIVYIRCRSVAWLCLTSRDPMDYSSPGYSVRGILQARMLA